ncbi:D-alanyl-D-alanine carboxypeptidase family protein [Alkalihalobacillus sp. AL-G]|uniref:D-alanyl-D-alanine carboxypeptidase family protein n=1 Tax=Alkalihalobacillus sp. AL-G TaxID=2926399 RepID=UPI00272BD710|nr:D-alanyl-D-alanine carboxypeptidase family protein [Alkalihalobacillus sp. AL-G]WLD93656.1 D-alanyl-D-alanine carboxypeptidase [Alkalihalobacillus sp. AL-G]
MKRIIQLLCVSALIYTVWSIPIGVHANTDQPTNLYSETSILIDASTGEILYEDQSEKRMFPASITKILTGILAIESRKLDETATISKKAVEAEGTSVYLLEGEKMKLHQLVKGMLINSGNDAGVAVAENLSGSVDRFAKRMNTFVQEGLGLTDSHFTNPHGLFDENHYTTAYDMAYITKYALENPKFRKIVSTKEMEWVGKGWETTLYNHNRLLWRYDGVIGVKNGYVDQSQHTLVTAAKRNGTTLIAVTMKADTSEQAYEDTIALLDYGFGNFETGTIEKGTVLHNSDGKEIRIEEEKLFTHKMGEGVKTKIDERGYLVVENSQHEEIASFPLLPKMDQKVVASESQAEQAKESVGLLSWIVSIVPMIVIGVFLLLVLMIILRIRRKVRNRRLERLRRRRMANEIHQNVFRR